MRRKTRYLIVGLLVVLLVNFSGCGRSQTAVSGDVLSQKTADPKRIPVTVLVKNAFSIHEFERQAEQVFPELDIIQVGNYTSDMGMAEYEARLVHDDLTDVVMTWPLNVGKAYWSERLLDLSAQPFSSRYNAARLDKVSQDGKLYYLPGPSQVRGIVYNKTLFREKGWAVPTDFEGFLALCQQIEASGIRALQLGLGNAEVLDTAFVGYSMGSCFSKPADSQWLVDYNAGQGSFAAHFAPALTTFQRLIDAKVLQPEDLQLTYSDRERMLFNRQCAMVEDSVLVARMGKRYNGCTDEFGLMPFFNPGTPSDWARLYPVCYIGVNKHLAEPTNKEKYDLVLRLMDYISTPAGQQALLGDTGAMFSSLNGMPPPDVPEITDILPALEHGRYAVFPTLKNAQSTLRSGLAGMVAGSCTGDEVAQMVDAQNARTPSDTTRAPVVGSATADFTLTETGNFVTDAMRQASGCDIALFLDNGKDGDYNGKGISARLYQGDLTSVDVGRILPDLKQGESGTLWKVSMTGAELLRTLEYAIPVDNNRTGWFYYFSGLRMAYDPTAEPGKRIQSITDSQGKDIDPERLYQVAVMDQTVPADALVTQEETGIAISRILLDTLARGPITPSGDGRLTIVTAR